MGQNIWDSNVLFTNNIHANQASYILYFRIAFLLQHQEWISHFLRDYHYSVKFKWQKPGAHCCCISVLHCCLYPVGWCVKQPCHVLTTTDSKHRMNLISDRTKGLSSQSSKQVEIVRFLLRPAGKQRRSLIQTCLKAQGNLRLVTTNVGLNSSSHYLWGEQERVQPKTIQKRATVWVKTCTNAQKHWAVRQQVFCNHLHEVLHFI